MKSVSVLIMGCLASFYTCSAQTTLFSANGNPVSPSLTTKSTNTFQIISLEMLGKTNNFPTISESLNGGILPRNFNWTRDQRRIESYKQLASGYQKQDVCGRDLPTADIGRELAQQLYYKSGNFKW